MKYRSNDNIDMADGTGAESPGAPGVSRAGYAAACFGYAVFHITRKLSTGLFWLFISLMIFDAVLHLVAPEQMSDFTLSSVLGAVLVLAVLFLIGIASSVLEEKMRQICSKLRLQG